MSLFKVAVHSCTPPENADADAHPRSPSHARRARAQVAAVRRPEAPAVAPAWLSNKLHRLGIQPVLADYATLSHGDAALDLIRAALTLAAPALARNPRELAPQLLARLAADDGVGLHRFLVRTQHLLSPRTLVPTRPTFTAPGAELRRFEHTGSDASVTVLGDSRRALSGVYDGTLRLWDLETGAEMSRLTLCAHDGLRMVANARS